MENGKLSVGSWRYDDFMWLHSPAGVRSRCAGVGGYKAEDESCRYCTVRVAIQSLHSIPSAIQVLLVRLT